MDGDAMLALLETTVVDAGQIALLHFNNGTNNFHTKPDGSPVTDADIEIGKYIESCLTAQYPSVPILNEEGVKKGGRPRSLWVIDPIDATENFVKSNPWFAISAALVCDGIPQLGVVYAPATKTLYRARRGHGAFKDGKAISISRDSECAENPLILLDIGSHARTVGFHANVRASLTAQCVLTESLECASLELCMVADGTADGFLHRGLAAWDIAAGILIAEEAGARITGLRGEPKDLYGSGIIATTPSLAPIMQRWAAVALDAERSTA